MKPGFVAIEEQLGVYAIEQNAKHAAEFKQGLTIADFIPQRRPMSIDEKGIANIHILGVLDKDVPAFFKKLNTTDYNDIVDEIREAKENSQVKGVFIDHDSPGGSVVGLEEAADALAELTAEKPVMSYTSSLIASADYRLAIESTALFASKSSRIGSIGTVLVILDRSRMLDEMGIKAWIITPKEADLKAAGNPMAAPTAEHLQYFQDTVEKLNAEFRDAVIAARGKVSPEALRGQAVFAKDALKYNLIDAISTRDEAYADLLSLI